MIKRSDEHDAGQQWVFFVVGTDQSVFRSMLDIIATARKFRCFMCEAGLALPIEPAHFDILSDVSDLKAQLADFKHDCQQNRHFPYGIVFIVYEGLDVLRALDEYREDFFIFRPTINALQSMLQDSAYFRKQCYEYKQAISFFFEENRSTELRDKATIEGDRPPFAISDVQKYLIENADQETSKARLNDINFLDRLIKPFSAFSFNTDLMELIRVLCIQVKDPYFVYDFLKYEKTQKFLRYIESTLWSEDEQMNNSSFMISKRQSVFFGRAIHEFLKLFLSVKNYGIILDNVFDIELLNSIKRLCACAKPQVNQLPKEIFIIYDHVYHNFEAIEVPPRYEDASGQKYDGDLESKIPKPIPPVRPCLWAEAECIKPHCHFRDLSSVPECSDILKPKKPYLRKMLTKGSFEDADDYLDVVVRLFREDLISPLRDGIFVFKEHGYKTNRDADGISCGLHVFDNIRIRRAQVHDSGKYMRFIEIPAIHLDQIMNTGLIIFGQMVALSSDGFDKEILLAKVVERDDKSLMSQRIGLVFMNDLISQHPAELNIATVYTLVESNAYLEMYSYVLSVIKNFNPYMPLPFERYFVECKTNVCSPPYMIANKENNEDFFKEEARRERKYVEKKSRAQHKISEFEANASKGCTADNAQQNEKNDVEFNVSREKKFILQLEYLSKSMRTVEHPRPSCLNKITLFGEEVDTALIPNVLEKKHSFDTSQALAVANALTQELCLIQGPPGTGKTFIGVNLLGLLLENRERWLITSPILVVCFTNQALDHILEKVDLHIKKHQPSYDGPSIVRLGSRSESPYVRNLMKKEIVDQYQMYLSEEKKTDNTFFKEKHKYSLLIGQCAAVLKFAHREILSGNCIRKVISDPRHSLLFTCNNKDTRGFPLSEDEKLATFLLGKDLACYEASSTGNDMDVLNDAFQNLLIDCEEDTIEQAFEKLFENTKTYQEVASDCDSKILYETEENWCFGRDDKFTANGCMSEVVIFCKAKKLRDFREVAQDPVIIKALCDAQSSILSSKPLTESEANSIQNIFTLPRVRRAQLYMFWIQRAIQKYQSDLAHYTKCYETLCKKINEDRITKDAIILRKALVIGATTTGVAKQNDLLSQLNIQQLIVEESAEILEAHVLASVMPTVRHFVMIGDHEQLRPKPSTYVLAREYNLDVSLFERLILNGFPSVSLQIQHRMSPLITSKIVRPYFYPYVLDASSVQDYPDVLGMGRNLFIWTHNKPEDEVNYDSTSHLNLYEISQAIALLKYLRAQGQYLDSEITVLCTYTAQTQAMRLEICKKIGAISDEEPMINVETLDGFQGKENRIIILSLVRSFNTGTIGFIGEKNRMCVALTRAKHGLYILGNIEYLSSRSRLWNDIFSSMRQSGLCDYYLPVRCQKHGSENKIGTSSDFAEICPCHGCHMECLTTLSCNHKCTLKCHPGNHDSYACNVMVVKACPRNEHYEEMECSKQFERCFSITKITLDCGHMVNISCNKAHERIICSEKCGLPLPCGHNCENRCSESCAEVCRANVSYTVPVCPYMHLITVPCCEVENLKATVQSCPAPCPMQLPCGHSCPNTCGEQCLQLCTTMIEKTLPCGHVVEILCATAELDHVCTVLVRRKLDCGHECNVPCGAGTNRENCKKACMERLPCSGKGIIHRCTNKCGECFKSGHFCTNSCEKTLKCGHMCNDRCGVECSPCRRKCSVQCAHQVCGELRNAEYGARVAYNRDCTALCSLCVASCDNACEHRECTKLCFEVCSVEACEKPCAKMLPCKHPCLGFCGEICPDLCFKCNLARFNQLHEKYSKNISNKEKLKIVQLSCGCIFPAWYLDLEFSKAGDGVLRCPSALCGEAVYFSRRYAKQIKFRILDVEMRTKMRDFFLVQGHDISGLIRSYRNLLETALIKMAHAIDPSVIERFNYIAPLFNRLHQILSRNHQTEYSRLYVFYAFRIMLNLVHIVQFFMLPINHLGRQLKSKKHFNLARFFRQFGDTSMHVQDSINSHFMLIIRAVQTCEEHPFGSFVPYAKAHLYKAAFSSQMWMLEIFLSSCKNLVDCNVEQYAELCNAAEQFTKCAVDGDLEKHYNNFLRGLEESITGIQLPLLKLNSIDF